MKIGQPKREIWCDPIELPEPLRVTPSFEPADVPQEEPVEEPVKHGA